MWRFIVSICLYFSILSFLNAQSASGLYLGPYSGINGVLINPASSRSYPMKWDLNIASLNSFGYTDYILVKETNLFHLLRNLNNFQRLPLDPIADPADPNTLYYDFPLEAFNTTASFLLEVNGPGFLFNSEKFSVGIYSRIRANGGSHSIPSSLSYFGIQSSFTNTEIVSGKASASGLYWSEYGITLSSDQLLPLEGISIGINIKYNRAHQGVFAKSFDEFSYDRISNDSLILYQPQFEFGITSVSADDPSLNLSNNGSGFSTDFGISTSLPKGLLNFSILDIGVVSVKNGEVYTLQSSQDLLIDTDAITNATNLRDQINEIDEQVSNQLDRITTIQSGNQFNIGLPTRIHLDYTYDFRNDRSILVSVDQRIPLFSNSLEAENVITLAPRYENKWWMITTPISIYEYSKIRVGLAARMGFLTIGTDHIASLIGKSDFRGSSFYAGLKFFPFWNTYNKNSSKSNRGSNVICPLN